MKNKKRFIVTLIFVVVLCLIFMNQKETVVPEKNDQELDLEQIQTEITNFTTMVIEEGINKDNLNKMTKQEGGTLFIPVGSDSYVRQKANVSGIDVNEYENAQEKYTLFLEEKIKENFEYEMGKEILTVDKSYLIPVTIKSYYYSLYVDDLNYLSGKLLEHKGYSPSVDFLGNETNESKAEMYKAKIKAMEILNNYIDEYYNDDEYLTIEIISGKDKKENGQELMDYLVAISGEKYSNSAMSLGVETYLQKQEERISNYIKEAISQGILDLNTPLELND